jgi:hypothetical protein
MYVIGRESYGFKINKLTNITVCVCTMVLEGTSTLLEATSRWNVPLCCCFENIHLKLKASNRPSTMRQITWIAAQLALPLESGLVSPFARVHTGHFEGLQPCVSVDKRGYTIPYKSEVEGWPYTLYKKDTKQRRRSRFRVLAILAKQTLVRSVGL